MDINWFDLQGRLEEYPELKLHESNVACHFEDAICGHINEDGIFIPESI